MYQTKSILALGSNIGNSVFNLRSAVKQLKTLGLVSKIADIYISKPYGYTHQNNFYNTAILLKTQKQPSELINNIYAIEKKLKKNKRIINGPRKIDIDIIFYGKKIYQSSNLTIPHPRAADRDFVLYPILDIDPFFQHPVSKKSVKTLAKELDKKFIIKKLSYRNLI